MVFFWKMFIFSCCKSRWTLFECVIQFVLVSKVEFVIYFCVLLYFCITFIIPVCTFSTNENEHRWSTLKNINHLTRSLQRNRLQYLLINKPKNHHLSNINGNLLRKLIKTKRSSFDVQHLLRKAGKIQNCCQNHFRRVALFSSLSWIDIESCDIEIPTLTSHKLFILHFLVNHLYFFWLVQRNVRAGRSSSHFIFVPFSK